jgi:hypothetical protein
MAATTPSRWRSAALPSAHGGRPGSDEFLEADTGIMARRILWVGNGVPHLFQN